MKKGIKPKIKEIDIIIEEGLKKIVEDKINEHIANMDFQYIAERVVENKFKAQLSKLSLPKITKKFSYEELLQRLDNTNKWGENTLDSILEDALKDAVENLLSSKFDISWSDDTFFSDNNLNVKDAILGDKKINKRFVKKMREFISSMFKK